MDVQDDGAFASNEYERQPVPEEKTKGLGSFVGLFGSEHVAATELLIGPLFVIHGVSAFDVLVGLLVGNLLAVLSWTLFVTPTLHAAELVSVQISHAGMILGTIGWFASAIFWIRSRRELFRVFLLIKIRGAPDLGG